jgi:hypothetical protein
MQPASEEEVVAWKNMIGLPTGILLLVGDKRR